MALSFPSARRGVDAPQRCRPQSMERHPLRVGLGPISAHLVSDLRVLVHVLDYIVPVARPTRCLAIGRRRMQPLNVRDVRVVEHPTP